MNNDKENVSNIAVSPQTFSPVGTVKSRSNYKSYILNAIDEKEVFALYLGISINDVTQCLNNNRYRISNPLRVDNHPSVSFKQYSSKIIMIDYANQYYRGDIFEIVGKIIGKDCNQSKDFIDICNDIINKFNITYSHIHKTKEPIKIDPSNIKIDIEYRELSSFDKDLFIKQGLKYHSIYNNIRVVDKYAINDEWITYKYTQHDPCYVYIVNPNKVKLYFPKRSKTLVKFITNNKCPIENIDKLKICKHLIITKAIKDKLLIAQMLEELNIIDVDVINLSSESIRLEGSLIDLIKDRYRHIYIMFDNDTTGLESTKFYKDTYGFIPIYFNLKFPNTKDPSDAVKIYKYHNVFQHFQNITTELKWQHLK